MGKGPATIYAINTVAQLIVAGAMPTPKEIRAAAERNGKLDELMAIIEEPEPEEAEEEVAQ
jgi:hypothetical protein